MTTPRKSKVSHPMRHAIFRVQDSSAGIKQPVSMTKVSSNDIRRFLFTKVDERNQPEIRRKLEEVDANVGFGIDYLALMGVKNYLGPSIYTTEDEAFTPSPGFLDHVRELLAAIQFSQKLDSIIRGCTRDGDVVLHLVRDKGTPAKVVSAKYIPIDAVTIIPAEEVWMSGEIYDTDPLPMIDSKGIYVINERNRKSLEKEDRAYQLNTPVDNELAIPATDILHISQKAENHNCFDRLGRHTFGVYGISKLDSLMFPVRSKLIAIYLYNKWIFAAMPRWFVSVDIPELQDANNPLYSTPGSDEAVRTVERALEEIGGFLYRKDMDEDSPTYDEYIQIEPDEWMIHTAGLDMQFKGGASVDVQLGGHIENMDRIIASALGVPMSLFGYEAGSTYAIGRITSQFTSGYGGGLLVAIEKDLFTWMRQEFRIQGWPSTKADWEHLTIDYLTEDAEKATAEATLENLQAQRLQVLATTLSTLVTGRILTPNEARRVLADGEMVFGTLSPVIGGDDMVTPQAPQLTFTPTPGTGQFAKGRKKELEEVERMEAETQAAVEQLTKEFILGLADKVEEGEI